MWTKVQGHQVMPPVYEKKVGRPPKNRRKQPHEVEGKFSPKMSKHGTIINYFLIVEQKDTTGLAVR
jgi:hypothetical protein